MTSQREHSHDLDNLRAVMMWLGIVLHVGVIHMIRPPPNIPYQDVAATRGADILVGAIHAFRIPVFLMVAGFFVELLRQRYGTGGMVRHRLRRIGLPFAVFWPLLYIGTIAAMAVFFGRASYSGGWWLDPMQLPRIPAGERLTTFHLWFLYQLIGYCLLVAGTAPIARRIPRAWRARGTQWGNRIATRWWGLPVLMLIPVLTTLPYAQGSVVVYGSFLPDWSVWSYYGVFFAFGLFLFHNADSLATVYARRWAGLAGMGTVSFLAASALYGAGYRAAGNPEALFLSAAAAYAATTWLWSFALIGGFRRFLARRRPVLKYIADSSYWVYLLHFPLTIAFGALLYGLDWGPWLKMGLNIAATTAVCLVTYHYLVRHTVIGVLLNGRRADKATTAGPRNTYGPAVQNAERTGSAY